MKRLTLTRFAVCAAMIVLLASGCAKKPVAEELTTPATQGVTASETTSDADTGIVEESISDSTIAEPEVRGDDKLAITGLERIYFSFDSFVLGPEAKQTLENNALYLKANSSVKVRIEGHCDDRGSDSYNLALGEKRARVAQDYLTSLGVAAERQSIISFGEEMPLDSSGTEAAWSKNRRSEFVAY